MVDNNMKLVFVYMPEDANRGYLEAKMQSDKKIIFFQNIEKFYISQWVKNNFLYHQILNSK